MSSAGRKSKKGLSSKHDELREALLDPRDSEDDENDVHCPTAALKEKSPIEAAAAAPAPPDEEKRPDPKSEPQSVVSIAMLRIADKDAPMRDATYHYSAAESPHPVQDGAVFLHEGKMNLFMDEHPKTERQIKLWFFIHTSWFPYFDLFMAVLYMALALIEPPATPHFTGCPKPVILVVQAACLATCVAQVMLRMKLADSWNTRKMPKGVSWQLLVVFVLTFDLSVYAVHTDNPDWHILRAMRPAYLLSCQKASEVRRVVRFLFTVLYEVIDMFVFLIFYIGIWAVMATFLFGPNPKDNYFANLGDSFTQLFVLITTCNYPSVMLPAYTKNQASFLFFFIFIVIGIYFILNLILAIVFRVYTEEERNKFRKRFLRQRAAIRFAYDAMRQRSDSDSGVTWEAFNECMKIYGFFRSKKQSRIMFCALNKPSQSGTISLEEMYQFYNLLVMDWSRAHYSTGDGRRTRAATLSTTDLVWSLEGVAKILTGRNEDGTDSVVQRLIKSPWTARIADICSDGIVLMQTIYLTVLASYLKSGQQSNEDEINRAILGFMIVFTVEAAIKIGFLGLRGYWMYPWHRFDMFFNVVGWIGLGCDRFTPFHLTAPVVILRAFRLASVLTISPRSTFSDVMTTAFTIMPRMARFGGALFCSFYFFAIVGMTTLRDTASNCPSGQFSKCGQPYALQLENPSDADDVYGFGHYQEMNFNNVWQSYVTLFTLMVINDWNNTMGGHAVAAGTLSRAFFMCFYLFTVLIVVNVILAYVLEMFQIIVEGQEIKRTNEKKREMRAVDELTFGVDPGTEPYSTATVITLKLSEADLIAVGDDYDRDLVRIREAQDPDDCYVVYEGRPRLTQTALYLMLFQENVQRWIEEEERAAGGRRAS
eukprot:CAMPEP_0206303278 /NCGR_PEP_ID=MMETSP0106_2-20121207/9153_1 /ASSEMBLY_ACC=CAM_ASM_000206 /TAXON_ID=81532 /ORGANISM="Acanthoeca-like sp., Strain 10tr" /LENGTH=877 /DNA_ID=CAMNT_0053734065 /DNA_START=24 /DNA_END=2653 /DNA_ORIENTATION=-